MAGNHQALHHVNGETSGAWVLFVVLMQLLCLRQRCIEEIGREESTFSIAESDNEALSDLLDETHLTMRGTWHVGNDAMNVQNVVAITLQLSLKLGDRLSG
jgi:hypothetical protein